MNTNMKIETVSNWTDYIYIFFSQQRYESSELLMLKRGTV